ncbi:MAG: DNA/RNA nuclease SfsA [Ascidiaceihabitans sp.]|jgi:sugar fermentation stimulation protein A|tara:strand:+ start:3699 stop:4403 length:705 start_codon:yes stop_codon:yes gene_type:complete
MRFQTDLIPARLIRRYKRFLADCILEDGREITAHCANPGSMMGLADEGMKVWLEPNDDPKRKLNFGWRLIEHENGHFTGVDTSVPNRALRETLEQQRIPELAAYETVRPEVKYGEKSRIDFLLTQDRLPDCYVEVKSVTLSRTVGQAEFPDSVTKRGAKHLLELSNMVAQGHRAVMLYLVQRTDCTSFTLASDIDQVYHAAYLAARDAGVETLCIGTKITAQEILIEAPITIQI